MCGKKPQTLAPWSLPIVESETLLWSGPGAVCQSNNQPAELKTKKMVFFFIFSPNIYWLIVLCIKMLRNYIFRLEKGLQKIVDAKERNKNLQCPLTFRDCFQQLRGNLVQLVIVTFASLQNRLYDYYKAARYLFLYDTARLHRHRPAYFSQLCSHQKDLQLIWEAHIPVCRIFSWRRSHPTVY